MLAFTAKCNSFLLVFNLLNTILQIELLQFFPTGDMIVGNITFQRDYISLLIMFQTTSDLSYKDNKSQAGALINQIVSLPNIQKKPASRGGEATSRKETSQKQKLTLPSLYYTDTNGQNTLSTDRDKENYLLKNKTAFAKQVKQRLNLVLGEMPHAENTGVQDGDESNDSDFEQKINQNKEIIKMHKLMKKNQKNSQSQLNKITSESKNKPVKKNRNQSLYEKRIKQYRDQSTQNRYLQKKKQTVKQQNSNNLIFDDYRTQDNAKQIISVKQDPYQLKMDKNPIKKSPQKRGSIARVLSQRFSHKNLVSPIKNDNLFDCIQNYLENPHEMKRQGSKQIVGLSLLKAKRDIQDKIKAINDKLGIEQEKGRQHVVKLETETARDWRRIQIGSKRIHYESSNFDKQLERICSLQQRNSLCLQKYLEQQKVLLELELGRNQALRKNANSH